MTPAIHGPRPATTTPTRVEIDISTDGVAELARRLQLLSDHSAFAAAVALLLHDHVSWKQL
jgi:hypothetical protein